MCVLLRKPRGLYFLSFSLDRSGGGGLNNFEIKEKLSFQTLPKVTYYLQINLDID